METIAVRDGVFADFFGRERVFNGINVVYKGTEPDADGVIRYRTPINDGLLERLSERGINLIRLGLTWGAVEPEPGEYNTEYLEGYRKTLGLCEKHGIYCLADFHQDLFSPFGIDAGDGAPRWACSGNLRPRPPRFMWAEGYFFDKSVQSSFDALWDNADFFGRGLRDRFCDMLTHSIKFFSGCTSLIGCDIFNEPFPGREGGKMFFALIRKALALLLFDGRVDRARLFRDVREKNLSGLLRLIDNRGIWDEAVSSIAEKVRSFDAERYSPFINAAAGAVRRASKTAIIFFENSFYSNIGVQGGIKPLTCGGAAEKNAAFAPHGYDVTVDTPLANLASPMRVDYIFGRHLETAERLGCPMLVGEWGGMVPGAESYPALEHIVGTLDKNRLSHTYWQYFEGFENGKIADIISRPLPAAVAGHIKSYGYDRKSREFTLSYTGDGNITAPTLVFFPEKPARLYSTKKCASLGNGLAVFEPGGGECVVKAEFC